jgi:hypothetical protein
MPRPIVKAITMLLAVSLGSAAMAATAHGAPIDVIRDCSEDGSLNRDYSQRDLSGALDELPSDLDEYTDCRSVIRAAQLAGARGKNKGSARRGLNNVDTATPATPEERSQLKHGASSAGPVKIGGRRLAPGDTGAPFAAAGLGTDLPTPVLLVLILLGLAMLSGVGYAARRNWPRSSEAGAGPRASPLRRIRDGVKDGIARFRR